MSVGYSFQTSISLCWNNKWGCYITVNFSCYFLICKQKFWFQKIKHSQLSLKCSRVHIEMNYMYEKFKRSDRPDRFRSLDITVNDFLSVVGERFFNDYLRIDTKRFPISGKWNSYMYILQQIGWINFRTVEDTRSQTW